MCSNPLISNQFGQEWYILYTDSSCAVTPESWKNTQGLVCRHCTTSSPKSESKFKVIQFLDGDWYLGHIFLIIAHLAMSFDWFSTCTRAEITLKLQYFIGLSRQGWVYFAWVTTLCQQILTSMTYFCIWVTEIASFWECSRSTEGGKRVGW